MVRVEGPDCICVGLARAGTGWLYRQLGDHPDAWMPPIKELDYLDRPVPSLHAAVTRLERIESGQRRTKDPRDRDFVVALAALAGKPRDITHYIDLFRFKGDKLSGDITPSYARLDDAMIAEIAARMPQVKIVFLVRDPVERAWSRISLYHRNDKFPARLAGDREGLLEYLRASETFGDASRPTHVMARWARVAPQIAFRHFYYDDLIERPEWLRAEILAWLGLDPTKGEGRESAAWNPKAEKGSKLPLTDAARSALAEHYRGELIACAEQFGDYGKAWAARYGF